MYRPPAGLTNVTSLMFSTRMPSDTLARIGLSCGSNASSVISRSVIRTGVIRLRFQANTVSAESIGRISIVPTSDSTSLAISTALDG